MIDSASVAARPVRVAAGRRPHSHGRAISASGGGFKPRPWNADPCSAQASQYGMPQYHIPHTIDARPWPHSAVQSAEDGGMVLQYCTVPLVVLGVARGAGPRRGRGRAPANDLPCPLNHILYRSAVAGATAVARSFLCIR